MADGQLDGGAGSDRHKRQYPGVQVRIGDRSGDLRGPADCPRSQRRIQGHDGRRLIGRLAYLQDRRRAADQPVGISGNGLDERPAGRSGVDAGSAILVQSHRLAIYGYFQADDVGKAVGDGVDKHGLTGDDGETRRQFDRHDRLGRLDRCQYHNRL